MANRPHTFPLTTQDIIDTYGPGHEGKLLYQERYGAYKLAEHKYKASLIIKDLNQQKQAQAKSSREYKERQKHKRQTEIELMLADMLTNRLDDLDVAVLMVELKITSSMAKHLMMAVRALTIAKEEQCQK